MKGQVTIMEVTFDRDKLISAITPIMGVVANRNTIASIEGILIRTLDDGRCEFTGYDLEKGMRTSLEADISEPGECIINANKLIQIIRVMPSGELTIYTDSDYHTTISSGNAEFELTSLPGNEFPDLPVLLGDKGFRLKQKDLRDMLKKVLFAVAVNDQRPQLNGAFFRITEEKITLVGCDGYRLAVTEQRSDFENAGRISKDPLNLSFVVPGKTLGELMKLIGEDDKPVQIRLTNKHAIIVVENVILFTRLIESDYVDYERLIPQTSKIFVNLSSEAFLESLERALLVTEDKQAGQAKSAVKLIFEGDRLTVTSSSITGRVNDIIDVDKSGEDLEIGFNCRYLVDALRVCGAENVRLYLNGAKMGMLIKNSEPEENRDFLILILPVQKF